MAMTTIEFDVNDRWEQAPAGITHKDVSAVGASTTDRCTPGNFIAPHGICVDSRGDLYVSEVTHTYGVRPKRVGEECAAHQLQKFTRRRSV